MKKTYKAPYPLSVLVQKGKAEKRIRFNPYYTTDDPDIQQQLEEGGGYVPVDLGGKKPKAQAPKMADPEPVVTIPDELVPEAPVFDDDEDVEARIEAKYKGVHVAKLFAKAREAGYPSDGSRKKKDILAYFVSLE